MLTWGHLPTFLALPCFFCQVYYWSNFHINIITGSRVMTKFLYKGLTRNPAIRKCPVWVLPNIWRLGQVRDTKFDTKVFNKMLLNAEKCQSYIFYCFYSFCNPHSSPRLRLIEIKNFWVLIGLYLLFSGPRDQTILTHL